MPSSASNNKSFFQDSSWLICATFLAGGLMWLVHLLNKFIPKEEYGTLGGLLTVLILVPTIPLQMAFAQQTAAALAKDRPQELAGMLHLALAGTFGIWLAFALITFLLRDAIIARLEIANPAALWVSLAVVLAALWTPLFAGVLHGSQHFKKLGWVLILQGIGRIGGAAFLVLVVGAMSAGIMTGALIGCLTGLVLSAWWTRDIWQTRGIAFDRQQFLRQVIPLAAGFAAYQFLLSSDTIIVNVFFDREQTAYYFAAGTLSRALVWTVGPIAAVMFPKIVHGSIRNEKTNLLALTLAGTAGLVALGAVGLWLLGPGLIRLIYDPTYVTPTSTILPWYAAAMVPLCLAAVMVNHLMAKYDFRIVPWLMLLAAGYLVAVIEYHPNIVAVLKLLGACCTMVFLTGAWFTWGKAARQESSAGVVPLTGSETGL